MYLKKQKKRNRTQKPHGFIRIHLNFGASNITRGLFLFFFHFFFLYSKHFKHNSREVLPEHNPKGCMLIIIIKKRMRANFRFYYYQPSRMTFYDALERKTSFDERSRASHESVWTFFFYSVLTFIEFVWKKFRIEKKIIPLPRHYGWRKNVLHNINGSICVCKRF